MSSKTSSLKDEISWQQQQKNPSLLRKGSSGDIANAQFQKQPNNPMQSLDKIASYSKNDQNGFFLQKSSNPQQLMNNSKQLSRERKSDSDIFKGKPSNLLLKDFNIENLASSNKAQVQQPSGGTFFQKKRDLKTSSHFSSPKNPKLIQDKSNPANHFFSNFNSQQNLTGLKNNSRTSSSSEKDFFNTNDYQYKPNYNNPKINQNKISQKLFNYSSTDQNNLPYNHPQSSLYLMKEPVSNSKVKASIKQALEKNNSSLNFQRKTKLNIIDLSNVNRVTSSATKKDFQVPLRGHDSNLTTQTKLRKNKGDSNSFIIDQSLSNTKVQQLREQSLMRQNKSLSQLNSKGKNQSYSKLEGVLSQHKLGSSFFQSKLQASSFMNQRSQSASILNTLNIETDYQQDRLRKYKLERESQLEQQAIQRKISSSFIPGIDTDFKSLLAKKRGISESLQIDEKFQQLKSKNQFQKLSIDTIKPMINAQKPHNSEKLDNLLDKVRSKQKVFITDHKLGTPKPRNDNQIEQKRAQKRNQEKIQIIQQKIKENFGKLQFSQINRDYQASMRSNQYNTQHGEMTSQDNNLNTSGKLNELLSQIDEHQISPLMFNKQNQEMMGKTVKTENNENLNINKWNNFKTDIDFSQKFNFSNDEHQLKSNNKNQNKFKQFSSMDCKSDFDLQKAFEEELKDESIKQKSSTNIVLDKYQIQERSKFINEARKNLQLYQQQITEPGEGSDAQNDGKDSPVFKSNREVIIQEVDQPFQEQKNVQNTQNSSKVNSKEHQFNNQGLGFSFSKENQQLNNLGSSGRVKSSDRDNLNLSADNKKEELNAANFEFQKRNQVQEKKPKQLDLPLSQSQEVGENQHQGPAVSQFGLFMQEGNQFLEYFLYNLNIAGQKGFQIDELQQHDFKELNKTQDLIKNITQSLLKYQVPSVGQKSQNQENQVYEEKKVRAQQIIKKSPTKLQQDLQANSKAQSTQIQPQEAQSVVQTQDNIIVSQTEEVLNQQSDSQEEKERLQIQENTEINNKSNNQKCSLIQ